MLRDMQLIVFSISHAAVMPSSAKIRPVVQHMPASTPTAVTNFCPLAGHLLDHARHLGANAWHRRLLMASSSYGSTDTITYMTAELCVRPCRAHFSPQTCCQLITWGIKTNKDKLAQHVKEV